MSKVASFSRLPNARKTFVVGLDGSNLSFQAIRTAAFQMDTMRDNMLIVTLKKNADDAATFERAHVRAKEIAMFYGVMHNRVQTELVDIPSDFSYAEGFSYLGNHLKPTGSAILALGAAGKGDQNKRDKRPEGQAPMGSLAMSCMADAKVPVLIVKMGGQPIDTTVARSPKLRSGRDGRRGLRYAVCCDGPGPLSKAAFDLACLMVKPGDDLVVFHVVDSDKSMVDEKAAKTEITEIEKIYEPECSKLVEFKKLGSARFELIQKVVTIREHIEKVIDEHSIDVSILGSAELTNAVKLKNKNYLGSVASGVTKVTLSHVIIVKNFPTTVGL